MQLVKKLSLKTIIGKPDVKALHEGNVAVDLFTVGGRLTGKKTGVSQFGEWVALTGAVGAVRLSDGEEFRGAELFLPSVAEAYVLPVIDSANGAPVDFAFTLGIKPLIKPNGELSYEYTVRPIVQADAVDPMGDLMARMKATAPKALTSNAPAGPVDAETGEIKAAEQGATAETEHAGEQEHEPTHGQKGRAKK